MNYRITAIVMGLAVCVFFSTAGRAAEQVSEGGVFQQREQAAVEKHRREMKAKNKVFRESLMGMSKTERLKAMEERRLDRFRDEEAFRQKLHDDEISFLRERLAANTQLSESDKEDLLKTYDAQYRENLLILGRRSQDTMTFFEKIANDPALTQAQKRDELKRSFQQLKAAVLSQRNQQRQLRQAELQKKYSAESSSAPSSPSK